MTDTELRPYLPTAPDPEHGAEPSHPYRWSRRRVLAWVCAGGALSAAGPAWLVATRDAGRPVPRPIAHKITRGRGSPTSFGSVAVLSALRDVRHDAAAHLHESTAGGRLPNRTWSTTVRVNVELHNGSDRAILLSPGQFRLRLGESGPTVSPYDVGRPVAAVAPARTLRTWVTYLAPAEETDLRLEYDDTGLARPLEFRLPVIDLTAPDLTATDLTATDLTAAARGETR